MNIDITERKRTEEEIQRLTLAVATVSEAVIIVGMDGRVSFVNRAAGLMTGYTAGELSGIEVFDLHAESSEHPTAGDIFEATMTDVSWTGEVLFRKKTGEEFPVRLSTALMKDQDGRPTGMVGIAADISERVELENRLLQAQKLGAVGQLAGGVAHDFNNLLTIIMGFTNLTISELPAGDSLSRLQEVQRAAGRAADLTRQLLAFSRRQIADPKILSLNDVVLNMDRLLRRLVSEDIEFVVVGAPNLAMVKADPGQMEQVLANLTVNARDAMSSGGKLTIETSNVALDEDFARSHPELTPGEYVTLSVRDTGTGMTQETMARAFEPFFTTKRVGQGTGLGLSICYGIVAHNDGHITIDSELGRGTIVRIYLPSVGAQASVAPSDCPGYLPPGHETVLLVEDEPMVRSVAAETLRGQGYTVLEAPNGLDALNLVMEHGDEPIDLLLTDMVMPLLGGTALVARLNKAHFGAKVLYTSGYSEESSVDSDVLKTGADFLQKPFTPATLAQKVRAVLDRP